jgi:hypothetical protein
MSEKQNKLMYENVTIKCWIIKLTLLLKTISLKQNCHRIAYSQIPVTKNILNFPH